MKLFTKERKLTPSWQLVNPSVDLLRNNIWQVAYLSFLPALLLSVGLTLLLNGDQISSGNRLAAGGTLIGISVLWAILAAPGFAYMQVQAVRGNTVSSGTAFKKGLLYLLPFTLSALLGGLAILAGLLAFIVPGLLLLRGFFLAPYYVVDQDLGPIAALKKSYNDSRPVTGWIWGVIGVEAVFALGAATLSGLPVIGQLLSLIINYIFIFGAALRYGEVAHSLPVVTAKE